MGVFPAVEKVVLAMEGHCYPEDEGISWLLERMGGLRAGEVLVEADSGMLLAVKYEYGDMGVAAFYRDGIPPSDLSRLAGLLLAGHGQRACTRRYVPASEVARLARSWARAIAMVFGEGYASRLVDGALGGGGRGSLTPGDLEAARAFISSALGDCLPLEKVNR